MALDPVIFTTVGDPSAIVAIAGHGLASLGFTVTPGPDGWSGDAEVGSAAGRFIGGGFVRRMKVGYAVTQGYAEGQWVLTVTPQMSGASGGLIGLNKARKEMESIHNALGASLQQYGHLG